MQSNLGGMEMLKMRVLIAALLVTVGIGCVHAADLPTEQGEYYSTRSLGLGNHTGMQVVYDFEPGVNMRAYWLAPWRHRHYYPRTGEKPEIGRDEDLSAPSGPLEPAETFRRHWSNSSAFMSVQPSGRVRTLEAEPPQDLAPLK
jgi:hypothetical protein